MEKTRNISLAFRQQRPKNKKNKIVLVFDEQKRAEFLTGFRKRKSHRRKIAQEEIIQQLKEEKRNKRKELRESRHREVHSKHCQPIPDVETLVDKQTYNLDKHTVTVTDVTAVDFVGSGGYMLGTNKEEEEDENVPAASKNEVGSDDEETETAERTKSLHKKHKFNPKKHKNLSHLMGKKGAKNKIPSTEIKPKRKKKKPRNPTS